MHEWVNRILGYKRGKVASSIKLRTECSCSHGRIHDSLKMNKPTWAPWPVSHTKAHVLAYALHSCSIISYAKQSQLHESLFVMENYRSTKLSKDIELWHTMKISNLGIKSVE